MLSLLFRSELTRLLVIDSTMIQFNISKKLGSVWSKRAVIYENVLNLRIFHFEFKLNLVWFWLILMKQAVTAFSNG